MQSGRRRSAGETRLRGMGGTAPLPTWKEAAMRARSTLRAMVTLLLVAAPVLGAVGSWSATGSMSAGRYAPTATLLNTGNVLVAGGFDGSQTVRSAQLYNPGTGTFSSTGSLAQGRNFATATLLDGGQVLV